MHLCRFTVFDGEDTIVFDEVTIVFDEFGIPTFDTAGNLSTFGGLATSQNYANPNFPVRGIDY